MRGEGGPSSYPSYTAIRNELSRTTRSVYVVDAYLPAESVSVIVVVPVSTVGIPTVQLVDHCAGIRVAAARAIVVSAGVATTSSALSVACRLPSESAT